MTQLKNRVVLITGASSGIGYALAREFASRGADLVLVARRADRLHALQKEVEVLGARALVAVGDVTKEGDLENVVSEAKMMFGRIDYVVANAGFGVNGFVGNLNIEDYRRQFETNVFGVLRAVYATLGELKKTKGTLVLIGSVSGHVAAPSTSAYAMSKFAVRALSDSLRVELKSDGVGVTLISPGFVRSDIRVTDNQGKARADLKDPIPDWLQMPTEKAARKIVNAAARRQRERVLTGHGKIAVWLQRFCPGFLSWVMGLARVQTRSETLNRS